ncbi:T9SS type A sorting domain-containing protein [Caldithrix abyssi]|nr:T9SS type A sorting domain-containing protein [Caldithrix abyssi]
MKKKKLMNKSFLLLILAFGIFVIPAYGNDGNNADLKLAWHEENDIEFGRGYTLKTGIDIDEDGWGEMLVYERLNESATVYKISLFEANADNSYSEMWSYQFASADIACGERGLMVTDLDNDGFSEITAIMCTVSGVNNTYVFEWDGTNNGLPATPTVTYDLARDTGGVVALENNVQYVQMDDDANLEMVLTHRGGSSTFLQILELSNSDLSNPVWNVEFTDDWVGAKNSGFGITDIDHDGHKEIIMWNEGTGEVRVYENTGTDAYTVVNTWTPTPAGYTGTVKSLIPAVDFDKDGVDELYLSDSKGILWVITPNGNVATMFDDANWHVLHDWKLDGVEYNEGGEVRGCIPGDLDRDGLPDLYFAGNNFGAVMDMEYEGGLVTNEDSYSFYYTTIGGATVAGGSFARPANVDLGDMDNDGHLELIAIVPWTGDNPVDNLKGLYVFEFDLTTAPPAGINTDLLSLAWHEENDIEFGRGYTLKTGIDIDEDGWGEMLVYERLNESATVYKISLFEANADNSYSEMWSYQFASADIACGERGLMVTDLDNDGFSEITAIMCTVSGVNNTYVFEWDGTNNGLPATPTVTYDLARDTGGVVALENNVQYVQMDDDANLEMVLTHRGGSSTFLQILELSNSDLSNPVWNVEFTDDWVGAKNSGFGITDIDHDGHKEIIMWNEGTGEVRVYENTGTDAYTVVNTWTPTPAGYTGTVKSLIPAVDFDKDGVDELYLSDSKGILWVITPNGNVATMFDDANWHVLHDWKLDGVEYNEGGEVRGCIPGDLDRDGLPDLYFAGNNFGAVMDMEYEGGLVTSEESYSFYYTTIGGATVAGGKFARPANVGLSDMDNDGHLELVAIVPWTGDNPVDNLKGLYVFEAYRTGKLALDDSFGQVPATYSLHQNYPNPFNPTTSISFDIYEPTFVSIRIYDLAGRSVRTLVNQQKSAGSYVTLWNGLDQSGTKVTSGIYIYRLETEKSTETKKMILLK